MKNKYKLKILLTFLIIVALGFLVEFLFFNLKLIILDHKDKGTHIISGSNLEKVNGKSVIEYDIKGKYVNKILINYSVNKDMTINVKLLGRDYYNSKSWKKIDVKLDDETNYQFINLNDRINKVKIVYDSGSKVNINEIVVDNRVKMNYFRVIFIVSILIIVSLLVFSVTKTILSSSLHKYFFVIGFVLGLTLIILQPSATFYSWDDQIHFKESYELGGGNIKWSIGEFEMQNDFAIGRDSISSIEEQENQMKYINMNKSSEYETNPGRFITYNKIAYIPSAIGYKFSKAIHLPFSISFKIGKIMNLFVYLVLMSFAIYKAKVGKKLVFIIGLLPSTLFLACQYSYDPAVISGITIGIVYLFNWFVDKNFKVNFTNLLIFVLAMLYACFTKAVYIPLMGLVIFIPHDRFRSKKEEYWIKGFSIIICLLVLATFALPSDIISNNSGDSRGGITNVSEQFRLIISNPVGYIKVLKDTFLLQFGNKMIGIQTVGSFAFIGEISNNLYIILLFFIMHVTVTDISFCLKYKYRILVIISILITMLLIWTALYLSFTPVGLNTINGVQSRYFIPFLYPLLICFQSNKIKSYFNDSKYNFIMMAGISLILFITIYKLILVKYCL